MFRCAFMCFNDVIHFSRLLGFAAMMFDLDIHVTHFYVHVRTICCNQVIPSRSRLVILSNASTFILIRTEGSG